MTGTDPLARVAEVLEDDEDVSVSLRQDARIAPKTETRTVTKPDTVVDSSGDGVTTRTVKREVEEEVVVGEKMVYDDRWLEVRAARPRGTRAVVEVVERVGLNPDEALETVTEGAVAKFEVRSK